MNGRTPARYARATGAATWIGTFALSVSLAASAHASPADPYASAGALSKFNPGNALDLAAYCNGSDAADHTSCVGRWLDDARVTGRHLYASPGTYFLSKSRKLFSGAYLRCADPATTVFKNTNASGSSPLTMGPADGSPADITIENCGFDVNGTTRNSASVISISGDASSAATTARNITIRGNRIFDSTQPGSMYVESDRQRRYIAVLGAQDVLIEGNRLSEGGRIKAGGPGNRIVIRNNSLHNVNRDGIDVVNVGTHLSSYFLVEGNTILNALGAGIRFGSDGAKAGTAEQRVEDVTVRNNKISGNQSACIAGTLPNHARRIYIEGNECHKTSAVYGTGGSSDRGVGISRADNSSLPIEDLTIKNNQFSSGEPGEFEYGGIFIRGPQSNLCIIGNRFHVGTSRAIFFHSSSSGIGSKLAVARLAGNVLNGATIRNSGTLAVDTTAGTADCFDQIGSVALTPGALTLPVGQSGSFSATVKDLSGNVVPERSIDWSSSAAAIASVAPGGTVRALAAGTALISASSGGRSASAMLTVTAAPTPTPSPATIAAPTHLVATASGNSVELRWKDNSDNEQGWALEQKTGAKGTFMQIATYPANITSLTRTSLPIGETISYRIRAYISRTTPVQWSDYSNEATVVTADPIPDPTNRPPYVESKTFGTPVDTPITFGLAWNEPDGEKVMWSATAAKNGFYTGTVPGKITYTPKAGFVGVDSFVVRAVDPKGAVGYGVATIVVGGAGPLNQYPVVELTAPLNGKIFSSPVGSIALTAKASDRDGAIARVEFYRGSALIGTATTAPYTVSWNGPPIGKYNLTAKAIDNQGAVTTSLPSAIEVR